MSLFLAELKKHPSTSARENGNCEPPYLLEVLRWTDDGDVRRAFLRFARDSDVRQRAGIIHHMGYTHLGQQVIGKRLAFLMYFLEDRTPCDPARDGSWAVRFLGKVTIRNLTASTLGGLLAQKPYPEKNWTAEQWEAYVQKLKQDVRLQRAGMMEP